MQAHMVVGRFSSLWIGRLQALVPCLLLVKDQLNEDIASLMWLPTPSKRHLIRAR